MFSNQDREMAAQIHQLLRQQVAEISADTDLTAEARQRRIAQITLAAQDSMRELRAQAEARAKAAADKAYRDVFGFRGSAAEERAYRAGLASLKPSAQEVQREFAMAQLRGDDVAIRGLAEYAFQNHQPPVSDFGAVLDSFAEMSDGNNRLMQSLRATNGPEDKRTKLEDRFLTEVPIPSELQRGTMGANLEAIAREPGEQNDQPARPMGMNWGAIIPLPPAESA